MPTITCFRPYNFRNCAIHALNASNPSLLFSKANGFLDNSTLRLVNARAKCLSLPTSTPTINHSSVRASIRPFCVLKFILHLRNFELLTGQSADSILHEVFSFILLTHKLPTFTVYRKLISCDDETSRGKTHLFPAICPPHLPVISSNYLVFALCGTLNHMTGLD